jgi:hypothetical protein
MTHTHKRGDGEDTLDEVLLTHVELYKGDTTLTTLMTSTCVSPHLRIHKQGCVGSRDVRGRGVTLWGAGTTSIDAYHPHTQPYNAGHLVTAFCLTTVRL